MQQNLFISKWLLLICTFLSPAVSYAQRQADNWYFGDKAGLNFSTGIPIALKDGQVTHYERSACISDENGNLLFYTDATTVCNKQHQIMQNGIGLFGNSSGIASAIIVPQPGNDSIYYIFTTPGVDDLDPKGFNYSIVNINREGGMGSVTSKNIQLLTTSSEKVTAVKHCNNRDIWVISRDPNNDQFYSWLITSSGVAASPVISHRGFFYIDYGNGQNNSPGFKASPNGKKIISLEGDGTLLADFDNATGIISNPIIIHLKNKPTWGAEFSPDCKLLYCFSYSHIFQCNITIHDSTKIVQSLVLVDSLTNNEISLSELGFLNGYSEMQLANNKKIYIAREHVSFLNVIESPNIVGKGCNVQHDAVSLSPGICLYGLPNFIQSYFDSTNTSYDFTASCGSLNVSFQINGSFNTDSIKWDFGDPLSGINNTSKNTIPVHNFSVGGIYSVKAIIYNTSICGQTIDTIVRNIKAETFAVNLGNDTAICMGDTLLLNVTAEYASNVWSDGTSEASLPVTQSGTYYVRTQYNNCIFTDTIHVQIRDLPTFTLGNDTIVCNINSFIIQPSPIFADEIFLWNDNSVSSNLEVSSPGNYWLKITDQNGCAYRDTIFLNFINLPPVNLGKDTLVCDDNKLLLDAGNAYTSYLWQDGSTAATYNVIQNGTYYITVNKQGCIGKDTIQVVFNNKPGFTLGPDQSICQDKSVTLSPAIDPSWRLLWQDGSKLPTYTVKQPGIYSLLASNECGSWSSKVIFTTGFCEVKFPNAFSPNGDPYNNLFRALGTDILSEFYLQIYNRYGERIFETRNKTEGWNGTFKGRMCETGSYVYSLQYKNSNSTEQKSMKGTFVLIR